MKVKVLTPYSGYAVGQVLEDVPEALGKILVNIGKAGSAADDARYAPRRARPPQAEPMVSPPWSPEQPQTSDIPTTLEPQSPSPQRVSEQQPEEQQTVRGEQQPEGDDMRTVPRRQPRSRSDVRSALEERAKAFGLTIQNEWSEDELRQQVETARRQRYARRDMRAQE